MARSVALDPRRQSWYLPTRAANRSGSGAIATGTVKWYDLDKGYGFVYEDNANRDVFLHNADIQETEPKVLYEGHRVRFEVEESDRGPRAVNVVVITGTEKADDDAEPVLAEAAEAAAE